VYSQVSPDFRENHTNSSHTCGSLGRALTNEVDFTNIEPDNE